MLENFGDVRKYIDGQTASGVTKILAVHIYADGGMAVQSKSKHSGCP